MPFKIAQFVFILSSYTFSFLSSISCIMDILSALRRLVKTDYLTFIKITKVYINIFIYRIEE